MSAMYSIFGMQSRLFQDRILKHIFHIIEPNYQASNGGEKGVRRPAESRDNGHKRTIVFQSLTYSYRIQTGTNV